MAIIAVSSVSLLNARADISTNSEKQQTEVKNNMKELKTQPDISIQQIVEKMIGTKEQADAEFLVSEGEYNILLKELGVARNLFTKEEFERFIELETESYTLGKKIKLVGSPEKLDPEEQNKYKENDKEIGPFRGKIYWHFRLTKKEAQKYLDFQIKTPTSVVKGFKLYGEDVQTSMTPGRKNPVIVSEYHRGDSLSWYVVNQSVVRSKEENPFYGIVEESEKVTNYELEGANITFAESSESTTKYMEVIVPAKGKNSAYQVIILANDVSKEELEKIMLSYIK